MKAKITYSCVECGYQIGKWLGKCPECGGWNTLQEKKDEPSSSGKAIHQESLEIPRLQQVQSNQEKRIVTENQEFNRVMGGGICRDSVTILTSPPGGGKSTLALTISNDVASQGYRVLYASGEESASQIKNRADRTLGKIHENIWIVADTSFNKVLGAITAVDPDFIIVDSIQTFALKEFFPARAGNPTQTMECAGEIVRLAKSPLRPRAVMLIGQMNKNDELAGLRSLEHLVDTVLLMDGEKEEELRSITTAKNRFGSAGEMGFFHMTEQGLSPISNPSEYFMTKREEQETVLGSALSVVREGTRPIIVEMESLVSRSFTPYPARIGDAIGREQFNTLISVMEQRCNMALYDKNVVLKATGGLRLRQEPAINLSVIVSIASSVYRKAVPVNTAFIADVGLTGELKKVPAMEMRIRELDRMGFHAVFVAKGSIKKLNWDHIQVVEYKTLYQLIQYLFQQTKEK